MSEKIVQLNEEVIKGQLIVVFYAIGALMHYTAKKHRFQLQ